MEQHEVDLHTNKVQDAFAFLQNQMGGNARPLISQTYHGVTSLQMLCHGLALKSGWWTNVNMNDMNVFGTKLCLVHSEVSEALEGLRKGVQDSHLPHRKAEEVELADAVIRIFDYAGARNLDV